MTHLTKHTLLLVAALACAVFGLTPSVAAAEKNIVLFVADDLGCDLGCYGNSVIRTPMPLPRAAAPAGP